MLVMWLSRAGPVSGTTSPGRHIDPRTEHLRQQARRELLAESRQHPITAKLRQIPSLGPIRSALAVALIRTPHRFRTRRQLWAYSGLALETRTSGEYRFVEGQIRRSEQRSQSRFERSVQRRRY